MLNPSSNKGGCVYQTETHLCGKQEGHTGEHYLYVKLIPPTAEKSQFLGTCPEVPSVNDFRSFCESTGRHWEEYSNIPLILEFADWWGKR